MTFSLVAVDPPGLTELASARLTFRQQPLMMFRPLLSVEGLSLLQAEVGRIALRGKRHDLKMRETSDTWRRMSTVGGELVSATSTLIPDIYNDPPLLRLLSDIAGEEVMPVLDANENHVINILHRDSDIHGGHVDTQAYGLNIILHAPPSGGGGEVEVCFGSSNPIDLTSSAVVTFQFVPGDAYFLKSSSNVHGVRPITGGHQRIALCFAYANREPIRLTSYSSSQLYK
jgi:hypothetical protein